MPNLQSDESCSSEMDSHFTISNDLELKVSSIEDVENKKRQIEGELMTILSEGSLTTDVEVVKVDVKLQSGFSPELLLSKFISSS